MIGGFTVTRGYVADDDSDVYLWEKRARSWVYRSRAISRVLGDQGEDRCQCCVSSGAKNGWPNTRQSSFLSLSHGVW